MKSRKKWKHKEAGQVGEVLVTGLLVLALTVLMMSYMECSRLIAQKMQIGQIARAYILKMETEGYLTLDAKLAIKNQLNTMGATEISFAGSTESDVGYGETIVLRITGKLGGEYDFTEQRMSTAKH